MLHHLHVEADRQRSTEVVSCTSAQSFDRKSLERRFEKLGFPAICSSSPRAPSVSRIIESTLQPSVKDLKNLHADFERDYAVELADSPSLVAEALRLRFQVYCLEQGYEDPADQQDSMESDGYDQRSVHSLLIHRSSNRPIGTARLVLPSIDAPEESFPIQRLLAQQGGSGAIPQPIGTTAEVSRFCISSALYKGSVSAERAADPATDVPAHDRRHACLGLIRGLVHLSSVKGVSNWVLLAEAALLRLLRGFGFEFQRLGSAIDFHGKRFPCYAGLRELLAGVWLRRPDVWEVVTDKGALLPDRDAEVNSVQQQLLALQGRIPTSPIACQALLS